MIGNEQKDTTNLAMFWPHPNTKNTSNKDPNPNSCHDTRMVGGQSNSHLFCGPSSHCCWKLSLARQNAERLWGQRNGVVLTNCINTVSFFTLDSCCSLWNGLPFWLHNFNRRALENVRVELDYGFVWDWSISKVAHAASLWIQSILREAIQSLLSLCLDLFPKSHDLFKTSECHNRCLPKMCSFYII